MILYNKTKCKHCGMEQSGTLSYFQRLIFICLCCLFIIPGLIYFFVAKPDRCKNCGLGLNKELVNCLFYQNKKCNNCNNNQGGEPYWSQKEVLIVLSCLFIIPGIIYFFIARPKCCFVCGVKDTDCSRTSIQKDDRLSTIVNHDYEQPNEVNIKNTSKNNVQQQQVLNKNLLKECIPIVEIRNLTKKYKGRNEPAINNVSFDICKGHFHAFIGANGAGKTTTIKSIISAYSKSKYQGNVKIANFDNNSVEAKLFLGYIPEEAKFPKKMTTRNYLIKMAMLSGKSHNDAKKIADNILQETKLISVANKCPNTFSSGQKKKVLLAQALINTPEVLIMDEPAANLDPLARDDLFENLVKLQERGTAIFLSSHILDEVAKYATYVTILDGGQIVFNGPIDKKTDLSQLYREYVKIGSVDSGIMK